MPWVKLDDSFDAHPKVLALRTDERRWTWARILIYTCRYRTPVVPANIRDAVPKANAEFVKRCIDVGLIDVEKDGTMKVHDWQLYNGETVFDKVTAFLLKKPDATANQVHKAIGGKREVVLAVFAQIAQGGSELVPGQYPNGTQPVPDSDETVVPEAVPKPVPLAGARGPDPSPSLDLPKEETFGVDVARETDEHQQPIDEREPEPREDPPGDLHELLDRTAASLGRMRA